MFVLFLAQKMKYSFIFLICLFIALSSQSSPLFDNTEKDTLSSSIDEFFSERTEGQWFLGFRKGKKPGEEFNQFTLKRGYVTFKHNLSKRLSARFTQDITIDREGMDQGNVEMRLKYCYLNLNLNDFLIFTDPAFEFGLVHRPWMDFEQKINRYRVQGTMFLERVGMMNSADFGVTFSSMIGGKMNKQYLERVNSKYPGKYGTFSIGVYNGAGYHALERNKNKTMESRLTLRPFPESVPGLQFSYNMIYGKGNTSLSPDFILNSGFLSYEREHLTLTAQYYKAKGNSSGSYVDSLGIAYENHGYSFFGEYKIPQTKLTIFGRYDLFDSEQMVIPDNQRYIFGIGYYFYQQNKLIVDVDYLDRKNNGLVDQKIYEAAIEIHF